MFLVVLKDNELGKVNLNKTKKYSTLEDAKSYCEQFYSSLGEPTYYEDDEYITYSREFCASDYLGYIEKL
jgi:hypothetical protein